MGRGLGEDRGEKINRVGEEGEGEGVQDEKRDEG